MSSLFDNAEYKAKKQEIKDTSIKAGIIGAVSGFAFLGAAGMALAAFGSPIASMVLETMGVVAEGASLTPLMAVASLAGSAALGATSFVLGIKAQRLQMDANMDMEDLEAQRHAAHLQMAFGDKGASKDTLIAYEAGRQRSDNKSWGDHIREQQRSKGMDPSQYR